MLAKNHSNVVYKFILAMGRRYLIKPAKNIEGAEKGVKIIDPFFSSLQFAEGSKSK
ncbi:MAG: hypothetical protein ACYC21_05270 [Eubacteriales bacterium]